MVVLFAVLLVVIMGMIALAVDSGMVMVARSEMQRSADAAVLASADVLAQDNATQDEVTAEAVEFMTANGLDPDSLGEDGLQVEFGSWDADSRTFTTGLFDEATATRVSLASTGNGLFFGRIFGAQSFDVAVEAIAVTSASNAKRDIMMVVDCSGSMDNDSKNPEQPMTAVKDGAQMLCDTINSDDRAGLSVYNWKDPDSGQETGHVEVGLTGTVQYVKTRINDLQSKFYTGGTNIAGGIHIGGLELNATARPDAQKELVVLTDGRANDKEPPYDSGYSADSSTLAWANDIRALGIIIHTISVGDGADHTLMAEVAGGSLSDDDPLKGKHFAIEGNIADYSAALLDAFEEIGQGTRGIALVQ